MRIILTSLVSEVTLSNCTGQAVYVIVRIIQGRFLRTVGSAAFQPFRGFARYGLGRDFPEGKKSFHGLLIP